MTLEIIEITFKISMIEYIKSKPGVVAHAFYPSSWEAEAGGFLSLRPVWSTKWVPGQPGLHRETLPQNTHTHTHTQTKQINANQIV